MEKENKFLVERVKTFETNETLSLVQTGTQTKDEDVLFCQDCEYPADDLYSLGKHVGEYHTETHADDFGCTFCGDNFLLKKFLLTMNQRNTRMKQKVPNNQSTNLHASCVKKFSK